MKPHILKSGGVWFLTRGRSERMRAIYYSRNFRVVCEVAAIVHADGEK
jgi:hypothetical protein